MIITDLYPHIYNCLHGTQNEFPRNNFPKLFFKFQQSKSTVFDVLIIDFSKNVQNIRDIDGLRAGDAFVDKWIEILRPFKPYRVSEALFMFLLGDENEFEIQILPQGSRIAFCSIELGEDRSEEAFLQPLSSSFDKLSRLI